MNQQNSKKRRSFFSLRYIKHEGRRGYRMAFILFWSIIGYFFLQNYVISLGIVISESMTPTMAVGGHFLSNKYIYHFRPPKRGEIVIIKSQEYNTEQYVKRIIGLPGETIHIQKGNVYINSQRLKEPYTSLHTFPDLEPLHIQENKYFVMGDNRAVSQDSRYFGSIPLKHIEGKIDPQHLFSFF